MIIGDTVHLALRNLGQAKLRTALTVLGVAIGIASLAGMVSLGVGLQDQLVGRFLQSGVFDAITVTPERPAGLGFGRGAGGRRGGIGGARGGARAVQPAPDAPVPPDTPRPKLDDAALVAIAALDHVKDVYPNVAVPVELALEAFSEIVVATGVPASAREEGVFRTFTHGAFFSNETDHACVLTLDMAKRISARDPKDLIGQEVTLRYATSSGGGAPSGTGAGALLQVQRVETKYKIAGIVERDPSAGFGGGAGISGLMIPLAQAKAIGAEQITSPEALLRPRTERDPYNSITVKVKQAQFTQDVEDRIKAMGYRATSLNDLLQGVKRGFIILDIMLSLIGSIALAVSSLGIVNTMVMSILERTREIGIMKAIGGSDGDIRRIFLVEASAIGLLGGVTGIALGWLVGRVINFGANMYIRSQGGPEGNLFSLPFWLIGGAIGFSIVVSLIAGSYPAARAAKLDPIQALRHD